MDTVPALQVFKIDLYGFGLSPSSLGTLSLPVLVVVFVSGLVGSYDTWVSDGLGVGSGMLMWY